MSKRPGPDDPGAPATASGSPSEPGTLTSDDIFGEILEEVGGERLGASEPAPGGPARGPIKVQVSEPDTPGTRTAARTPPPPPANSGPRPRPKELLPEDVETLLDAFAGPEADAAVAEEEVVELDPEALPASLDEVDGPALILDLDAGDPRPPWTEPDDELPPPPPPAHHPSRDGMDEGLRDLMNLMRSSKARAHKMGSGPNKFVASTPASAPAPESIDLAAVAEQALDEAAAEAGSPGAAVAATAAPAGDIHYGPYRLLQRIAVGGMAEVFRAKRTGVEGFEKVVAVKRILPHLSDNKEFVDMFIDEAKMVAGLTHPNIVQIFDLGKIDKTYFIALEYVHGRDLRTILRRAREKGLRLPLDLALLIVSRVCSALEFAHRKKDERGVPMQIVHRDVSPQNILISFEGEVKLTDFGIAKAATKASITDSGALRGKLLYMSPEQAWGKPMDRRSDVFSLGIVFYEVVTDQKPFLGSSEKSILETVRECEVAPPSQLNPRIPEKLERVLMKALARDVDERYQDAAEMYKDLERVLHERQPPTAAELARFMEVLFDEPERLEAPETTPLPSLHESGAGGEVHVDFDGGGPPPQASPPAEPAPEAKVAAPAPAPTRDPMSIQKLLRRFGIK